MVREDQYYLLVARVDVGIRVAVAMVTVVICIIGVIVEVSAGTRTTSSVLLLVCFAKLSIEEWYAHTMKIDIPT